MTIRHLKIFLCVVKCNSITLAAEQLHVTQPAVSMTIKEMEQYYGVQLFERLAQRIKITDTGKQLFQYATHLLSMFDEMELNFKNADDKGILSVGASITIGQQIIPKSVKTYQGIYPNRTIHVHINSSKSIEEKIANGDLDVGFIEGIVHFEQIRKEKFMEDEIIAVCNPMHDFAKRDAAVSMEEFLQEPLLVREKGSGTRELFDSVVELQGLTYEPTWESISTQALINGVLEQNGVSVLPKRIVTEEIATGRLAPIPLKEISMKRAFYLIYHKNKYQSIPLQDFIQHTKNYVKKCYENS